MLPRRFRLKSLPLWICLLWLLFCLYWSFFKRNLHNGHLVREGMNKKGTKIRETVRFKLKTMWKFANVFHRMLLISSMELFKGCDEITIFKRKGNCWKCKLFEEIVMNDDVQKDENKIHANPNIWFWSRWLCFNSHSNHINNEYQTRVYTWYWNMAASARTVSICLPLGWLHFNDSNSD